MDTGASLSLMAETTFRRLWPSRNLNPTEIRLCTYSKQTILVLGSVEADVARSDCTVALSCSQGRWPNFNGQELVQQNCS